MGGAFFPEGNVSDAVRPVFGFVVDASEGLLDKKVQQNVVRVL